MSNLRNDILIIKGMSDYSSILISSLPKGFEAILYKEPNEYGVAFNFNDEREIKYKFVNVILETKFIEHQKILYLHSQKMMDINKFAVIAENFLMPANREYILKKPYDWCDEWKNIFGNSKKNMLVSDLVSELIVYRELAKKRNDIFWGASNKTTHDFEISDCSVEVKSTINKTNTIISINSNYQLKGDKPVYIFFCRLEKVNFKNSINSLINELINLGINEVFLDEELEKLGYPKGIKERETSYDILEVRVYDVLKSGFPNIDLNKINQASGINNIIKYSLELDLTGIAFEKIL